MAVVLLTTACFAWVRSESTGHIFSAEDVPPAPVGLVLGTQVEDDGRPSAYLLARLELARRLFITGKVRVLLVSGDHKSWGYDEPGAMRSWLLQYGVPDRKIVRDFAGFDTYDSCARAVRIFGVHQAIVITQSFHIPRAVTLCRQLGMDAAGVGDDTVAQQRPAWVVSSTREYGACVKAVLDLRSGRDPAELGPRETGVDDGLRDP